MLGQRIAQLRKEAGLTQAELSKKLGISRASLSLYEIEKREPDIDTLVKMSTCFDVQIDYLLGLTDERHHESTLSWRLPSVSNRFGTILKDFRKQKGLTEKSFAEQLNITEQTYIGIENGFLSPSINLLKKISSICGYDLDYLTGASDTTAVSSNLQSTLEADFHFRARFEELCFKNDINFENAENILGLSPQEFIDISYNRMPTLSELLRISYALNISLDYLIGRVDTPISNLSTDEIELILNYRDCREAYKKNLLKRSSELSIASIDLDSKESVAADSESNSTGKSLA